jgi:hypothetical protein
MIQDETANGEMQHRFKRIQGETANDEMQHRLKREKAMASLLD